MDLLRSRTVDRRRSRPLIVIVGGGWLAFGGTPEATPQPTVPATPSPSPSPNAAQPSPSRADAEPHPQPEARCPLNGMTLDSLARLDLPALAVQIENHRWPGRSPTWDAPTWWSRPPSRAT